MKKQTLFIAIALLAGAAIAAYYFTSREPDYNQLAADYFTVYPNEISNASRSELSDTTDKELGKLMAMYEEKRFDEALEGFNQYLEEKPGQHELKFYRGIINLKNDHADLAVSDFENVVKAGKRFKDQAEWYLGLAYLKNDQKKEAADLFFRIADSNSPYKDKAYEIVNKIPYKPYLKKEIENM